MIISPAGAMQLVKDSEAGFVLELPRVVERCTLQFVAPASAFQRSIA